MPFLEDIPALEAEIEILRNLLVGKLVADELSNFLALESYLLGRLFRGLFWLCGSAVFSRFSAFFSSLILGIYSISSVPPD